MLVASAEGPLFDFDALNPIRTVPTLHGVCTAINAPHNLADVFKDTDYIQAFKQVRMFDLIIENTGQELVV